MTVFLAQFPAAEAEIIDRIAVSVGNRVITLSQVERQARLTAFLNNAPPDLSPAGLRRTAGLLVEQMLVRRELEAARYPAPTASEADPGLKQVQARFPTQAAFEEALRRYGLTVQDLRDYLLWQLMFLRFIDVRFRPGVQVTEQEMRDYYEKTVRPAALEAHPGQTPAFDEYRERIEQTLTGQRVDQEFERWLEAARRRTRIEYREGAFQ